MIKCAQYIEFFYKNAGNHCFCKLLSEPTCIFQNFNWNCSWMCTLHSNRKLKQLHKLNSFTVLMAYRTYTQMLIILKHVVVYQSVYFVDSQCSSDIRGEHMEWVVFFLNMCIITNGSPAYEYCHAIRAQILSFSQFLSSNSK